MSQPPAPPDIDALEALLVQQRAALGPGHPELAAIHDKLAQASQQRGDPAMMLHHLDAALTIRRNEAVPDRQALAVNLAMYGIAAAQCDRFAAAQAATEEAVAILRTLPDEALRLAQALDGLAPILAQTEDLAAARAAAEEALSIRRAALGAEDPRIAASLQTLATLALQRRDIRTAKHLLGEALALRRKAHGEAHFSVGAVHSILGDAALLAGEDRAARDHFAAALRIRVQALGPMHPLVGFSHNNLARAQHHLGEYGAARESFQAALAVFVEVFGPEPLAIANTVSNLAELHRDFGRLAEARDNLDRALAIQRRVLGERHRTVSGSLATLAGLHALLGDDAAAEGSYRQALAILRDIAGTDSPDSAIPLDGLAALADRRGAHEEAAALVEESLALRRATLGPRHPDTALGVRNRGLHRLSAGDAPGAIADLHDAATVLADTQGPEHPDVATCEVELAGAYLALGQLQAARGHAERALVLSAGADNPSLRWHALSAESRVLAAQGDTAAAIFFGKAAVAVLQQLRAGLVELDPALQRSFVNRRQDVYRHLAGLLVDAGRLAEAARVLAMLKEDEFYDLICRDVGLDPRLTFAHLTSLESQWQRHGDDTGSDLAALAAEARRLRNLRQRSDEEEAQLRAARAALDEAGRRFDAWLHALIADFAQADATRAQDVAALNLHALQAMQGDLRALGTGVVMLHFLLRPDRLAIIVTAPGLQASRDVLVSERAVNRLVHELRVAIELRTDDVLLVAQVLHRHLIAPVEDLLAQTGARSLLLVLDGVLRYAPLAALHDGTQYLIERFALAILTPAAQTRLKDVPSAEWQVGGLGVSHEVPGYARLPSVRDELSGIVRAGDASPGIYPGTIYLDDDFTEAALIDALDRHQAVHLASHFVFEAGNELASRLLLGDGGTLTLDRLRDRSFDFSGLDLIALSACETAIGGGREGGREIEGFAALVQTRGARAVVATLWPVADASTAALMHAFYRQRRDAALSKAEALRAAQLALLHGEAGEVAMHPYHWAPFILMGNPL